MESADSSAQKFVLWNAKSVLVLSRCIRSRRRGNSRTSGWGVLCGLQVGEHGRDRVFDACQLTLQVLRTFRKRQPIAVVLEGLGHARKIVGLYNFEQFATDNHEPWTLAHKLVDAPLQIVKVRLVGSEMCIRDRLSSFTNIQGQARECFQGSQWPRFIHHLDCRLCAEIFEGASPSFFPGSVALGEPGMFPPSSTGSTTFSHLRMDLVLVPPSRLWKREGPCNPLPPPQTSVWKVDRRGGVVVLVQRSTKDQDQERSRGDTTRDGREPPTSCGAHESEGGARRASAGGMFRHRQPGTRAEVPVEDAGALRRSPFPPAKTLTL